MAQALIEVDPASRAAVGFIGTYGTLVVFGEVQDVRVRQAIEVTAVRVPEVRMVINQIRFPHTPVSIASGATARHGWSKTALQILLQHLRVIVLGVPSAVS